MVNKRYSNLIKIPSYMKRKKIQREKGDNYIFKVLKKMFYMHVFPLKKVYYEYF